MTNNYGTDEQAYDCSICRSGFEKERDEAFAAGAASRDEEMAELKAYIESLNKLAGALVDSVEAARQEITELKKAIDYLEYDNNSLYESEIKAKQEGRRDLIGFMAANRLVFRQYNDETGELSEFPPEKLSLVFPNWKDLEERDQRGVN